MECFKELGLWTIQGFFHIWGNNLKHLYQSLSGKNLKPADHSGVKAPEFSSSTQNLGKTEGLVHYLGVTRLMSLTQIPTW
jgi:hypothetical protein